MERDIRLRRPGLIIPGRTFILPKARFVIHAISFDHHGRKIGEGWGKNNPSAIWKQVVVESLVGGTTRCARKLQILDTGTPWSSAFETASRKAGTGEGSTDNFVKYFTFNHPGGGTTYSINQAKMAEVASVVFATGTIAPAVSLPPGGQVYLEYMGQFQDDHDVSNPGITANYFLYELARAQGQDVDSEALVCGALHLGWIKLEFTQGGVPQTPLLRQCTYSGGTFPTETTYGSSIFVASGFTDGASAAATPTKVVLIPSDAIEAHAYGEQTSGLGGPFDFSTGSISISCECKWNE